MTRLDDETLTELQRLSDAATPGPWVADRRTIWQASAVGGEIVLGHMPRGGIMAYEADVALMAAAPSLLGEVVRLRATIEAVRALHRRITTTDDYGFCTGCEYQWPCPTVAALGPAGADRQEQP